jgi:hypothetical protein
MVIAAKQLALTFEMLRMPFLTYGPATQIRRALPDGEIQAFDK